MTDGAANSREIPEVTSVVLDRSDPEFLAQSYDLYAEMCCRSS